MFKVDVYLLMLIFNIFVKQNFVNFVFDKVN